MKCQICFTSIVVGIFVSALSSNAYVEKTSVTRDRQNSALVAPEVDVQTVELKSITFWDTYVGYLKSHNEVVIRPRVSSQVSAVHFKEGENVKQGDLLFTLDAQPFVSEVAIAEAALSSAIHRVELSKIELNRASQLAENQAISESELDALSNGYKLAMAAVEEAKSQLTKAQLNLSYTTIKAPISGRTGQITVHPGNLVHAGVSAPQLTSIVPTDKLIAEFELDEKSLVRLLQINTDLTEVSTEVHLASDKTRAYASHIYSLDNQLDRASGSILVRLLVDSANTILRPGMYITVRIALTDPKDAILIPGEAIRSDQDKKYAWVVNKDHMLKYREIQLGRRINDAYHITSGLESGQIVVISSDNSLKNNMKVTPVFSQQKGEKTSTSTLVKINTY